MKNILLAAYLLFLTFLIGSAIFASKTFDGDIRNSYEKGMAYPVEKSKIKEKGWSFSVKEKIFPTNQKSTLELLITSNNDTPVTGASVTMKISRLTQPYTLPLVQAEEQDAGHYIASVNLPYHGHWQANAAIEVNEDLVHHQFKFYAKEGQKK